MPELPDEKIDCVLTSPPYYGLRDYGEDVKEIWGGDSDCEHNWKSVIKRRTAGGPQVPQSKWKNNKAVVDGQRDKKSDFCSECNAWYGALGLEPTFQLYLDHMMIICQETKRVLKKTGSFWLNMGDTYGGSGGAGGDYNTGGLREGQPKYKQARIGYQKCLLGIPWRLVLRLIDEQGWVLRNAIIWSKPNSMPSSVKDRLSNSYEFLFHLVKNTKPQYFWNEETGLMADRKPKVLKEEIDWHWVEDEKGKRKKRTYWHSLGYWYDLDAIREPYTEPLNRWGGNKIEIPKKTKWRSPEEKAKWQASVRQKTSRPYSAGKNPGDCWRILTQSRPEAHFATFPDKLCIKPILATCPAEVCKKCGKAKVRIVEKGERIPTRADAHIKAGNTPDNGKIRGGAYSSGRMWPGYAYENKTIGWTDCGCGEKFEPGVLLDPFAGRGTALIEAKKMSRHYVGYELSKEYCTKLIQPALDDIDPLFRVQKH
ncbi:hypothetical protein ES703_06868 [subsurface metagenome]